MRGNDSTNGISRIYADLLIANISNQTFTHMVKSGKLITIVRIESKAGMHAGIILSQSYMYV